MKLRTSEKLTVMCWPSAEVISTGLAGLAACRALLWAARCCIAVIRAAVVVPVVFADMVGAGARDEKKP